MLESCEIWSWWAPLVTFHEDVDNLICVSSGVSEPTVVGHLSMLAILGPTKIIIQRHPSRLYVKAAAVDENVDARSASVLALVFWSTVRPASSGKGCDK